MLILTWDNSVAVHQVTVAVHQVTVLLEYIDPNFCDLVSYETV